MGTFDEWLNSKKKNKDEEQKSEIKPITQQKETSHSFDDWLNSQKKENRVDSDYINNFISEANNYMQSAQRDFGKGGFSTNYANLYNDYYDSGMNLTSKSNRIYSYLEQNKSNMDRDEYDSLSEYLTSFNKGVGNIVSGIKQSKDIYGQFNSEEEYNKAVDDYNSWREANKQTLNATEAEDYAEYSKKGADIKNPSMREADGGMNIFGWRPFSEDVENVVTYTRENYGGLGMGLDLPSGANAIYNHMTDDEVGAYNYYLAKERDGLIPKGTSNDYLKSIENTLKARQAGELVDKIGLGEENTGFIADTARVAFGLSAGLDQFGEGMRNLFNFGDDVISPSTMQYASQMVRENMGNKVGRVAYDLASTTGNMIPSIAASAFVSALATPVVGEIVGTSLMGASAAGNEYAELLNSGMDKWKARGVSTLLGLWEGASEHYLGSIEGLGESYLSKAVGDKLKKGFVSAAVKFGLDMAEEGFEEVVQDIGSSIIKGVTTGDWEFSSLSEFAYSFTLGALTAGVLNGTRSGIVRGTELAKSFFTIKGDVDKINALKNVGSTFAADTVAYKLTGQIDENTGAWTLSRMLHDINANLTEQNQASIAWELQRNGMAEADAKTISEWLGKAVSGENFTKAQRKVLENNPIVSRVYKKVIVDANSTVNQRLSNYEKSFGKDVQYGLDFKALAKASSAENISNSVTANYRAESELGLSYDDLTSDRRSAKNKVNDAISARLFRNNAINGMERAETRSTDAYLNDKVNEFKAQVTDKIAENNGIKTVESVSNKVSDNNSTTLASTGEDVKIKKVSSNENGNMKLELADGSIVDSSDVLYRSKDDAVVYETLASMGVPSDVANSVITGWNNSGMSGVNFMLGVDEAYKYGKVGLDIAQELQNSSFASEIPEAVRNIVYRQGVDDAKAEINRKNSGRKKSDTRRKGAVHAPASFKTMTERQKQSIRTVARVASDITNNDVYIYESVLDENGNRVLKEDLPGRKAGQLAPHGVYDPKTGAIYIDLNAGNNGEGVMLYTFAHELTHFVRDWSPAKFKALADFVIAEYGKKGVSVSELIKQKMSARGIGFDEAYEEVIADSMQPMFTDANLGEKLAKLKSQDAGLFAKIKEFFTMMYNKIKALYKGLDPYTDEGKYVKEMKNALDKISDMFAEAVVDAGNTFEVSETGMSENDGSASFSLREKDNIENRSMKFYDANKNGSASHISSEMITEANKIINKMADYMLPFLDIKNNNGKRYLPEEILGKTTFANGSYGKTIENTTICFRTLAYIDFTNEIKKKIGRPLTVEESFLASQMLYDIAKEPQCLYCYVSLDRKAYDGFLLEYIKQRDDVLNKFAKMDNKSKKNIDALYTEFLNGRKDTKHMKQRFNLWINSAVSGDGLISLLDLTTEEVRSELKNGKYADQVIDAERYAQNASHAKKLEQYRSYNSDILNMSPSMVKKLNAHYGLRFYSFSDYTPAFIVENMQQIRDASMKGLYGLAYTKKTDFARIFANTGMNINISVFGKMVKGKVEADTRQGADWSEVQELRKQFKNVGAVFVATNDELTEWALAQDWIDVVIPFHIVRTGANVAEFYKWTNNTKFQADVDASGKNKTITPAEHHNDLATFKRLVEERGLTPRFAQFIKNPNYMKLVNETRLADTESSILTPNFNEDAAIKSFDAFVNDGGYYGNWYEEGIDYKKAIDVVEEDVLAGRRANEVSYGRQDIDLDEETKRKNRARVHGNTLLSDRDISDFAKGAEDYYGTTNNWELGGYLTVNGKMLDFSAGQRQRVVDHREIADYYDDRGIELSNDVNEGMIRFMNDGNIRFQSYSGFELAKLPTKKQFDKLADIIDDYFYGNVSIDYSDETGRYLGTSDYEDDTSSTRIISDIKKHFEDGSIPEGTAKFSIREIVSESGKNYGKGVYLDSTLLDNLSDSERIDLIKEYVRELAHKELSAFDKNGNEYLITVLGSEKYLAENGKRIHANSDFRKKHINNKTKQEAIALIDEVVISSKIVNDSEEAKHAHDWIDNDGKNKWSSLHTYVVDKSGDIWSAVLSISKGTDGKNYLYDLSTKKEGERVGNTTAEPLLDKKISQNESDVNSKYSDRDSASYTEERIDKIIAEYGASNPNYAQAYVATISPRDFLKLTINDEVLSKWNDAEGKNSEIYPLDKDKLSGNTQSPFLTIEDGEVIGHEGRHRMRAMMNAGITRVPVIIRETSTKYSKKKMPAMTLTSQDFGRGNVNSGYRATITNLIPTNKVYRDDIISSYGRDSELKFSERDTESFDNRTLLANAMESVAKNDIEKKYIYNYKSKIDAINEEERKLSDLRAEIKELSFSKGKRDTERIKSLQDEATKSANRINTYDKQLLKLEASAPLKSVLEREKASAIKKAEAKAKQALSDYRESAMKKQEEIISRYQEARRRGIVSRGKTELRGKIKSVVKELNDYLLHGTKKKHILIGLQKPVAEALNAINMDTVGADERIAKYDELIAKTKDETTRQALIESRDRIAQQGNNLNDKLSKLKTSYADIINSDDPLIANSYDEVIANKIDETLKVVGDTSIRDMDSEQLQAVYDMFKMVLTSIRNSNKAFTAEKTEDIVSLASQTIAELDAQKKKSKLTTKGRDLAEKFTWNNLKPVYAFKQIGSKTFEKIFSKVRAGEDTWARDIAEAKSFYEEVKKKYPVSKWDTKKTYEFESTSGKTFNLNLNQIMSLYAFSKRDQARDQARDHIRRGGIVIDERTEVKKGLRTFVATDATAYNISDNTLSEIISELTPEQKAYVDEMQTYLSEVMGEKGNEVTLQMYGVKLFGEKFYFPLKSATQYMAKAKEQMDGTAKIKNAGFSKETVSHASNPIVLTEFMDVWAGHVDEMSRYHAFVLPMEDFYRVFNFKTATDEELATESVEMYIENVGGKGATQYIENLLKDLNGGTRADQTAGVLNKFLSLFKKGAVMGSASVVIQQPSAIARAFSYIEPKYFIGEKVTQAKAWEELKKYAPVAIIKEMGGYDTHTGASTVDYIKGDSGTGILSKFDDFLAKAPELADQITWDSIWQAAKRKAKYTTNLTGEELLKKAGDIFTEAIVNTQVYDSVLSRSANMRSKDGLMKMATAFMAEPTTSINMVQDAINDMKKGNRASAVKKVSSVVASVILNSLLVAFVYAARDDDDDETYWEKYITSTVGDILEGLNPVTYIPVLKDIYSEAMGYTTKRTDISVFADLIKAINNFEKDGAGVKESVDLLNQVAMMFGIPTKNLTRDYRAIVNTIGIVKDGEPATKTGYGLAFREGLINGSLVASRNMKMPNKAEQMYMSVESGDEKHFDRVLNRYDDASKGLSAYNTFVLEMFEKGKISEEKAINYMVTKGGLTEEEASKKVSKKAFKVETGVSYEDREQAYNDGKVTREQLIDALVSQGKSEEDAEIQAKIYDWQNEGYTEITSPSEVNDYYDFCESAGISKDVYYDALLYYQKSGSSEKYSKVKETIPYIDSLPLNSYQKTQLALCWWAESTVDKYKTWK